MRKIRSFLKIIVLFVLLGLFVFYPVNYFIIQPGVATDLSQIVSVENGDDDDQGAFLLTAVSTQRASTLKLIWGMLNPDIDVIPATQMLPQDIDMDEYLEIMKIMMEESQLSSGIVALKEAGEKVDVSGKVTVHKVLPDSPAQGKLEAGDVIEAVDGKEVIVSEELVNAVQDRKVGDTVHLKVKRGEEIFETDVKTGEVPEKPGKPVVKILVVTQDLEYHLPVDINFDTENIAGPSAGLMFSLEIYNQLKPEDISREYRIAGTGTIDINGDVGEIGGIKQKVIAAEREGAEYFFAPVNNLEEAKQGAKDIKLIPVENFKDAMEFLNTLDNVA